MPGLTPDKDANPASTLSIEQLDDCFNAKGPRVEVSPVGSSSALGQPKRKKRKGR